MVRLSLHTTSSHAGLVSQYIKSTMQFLITHDDRFLTNTCSISFDTAWTSTGQCSMKKPARWNTVRACCKFLGMKSLALEERWASRTYETPRFSARDARTP